MVLSVCNANDTVVKDAKLSEKTAIKSIYNEKSMSFNIDDLEAVFVQVSGGMTIRFFHNGKSGFRSRISYGGCSIYESTNLEVTFNSLSKDKNNEVKFELFDSYEGNLLYVLTQDDFPNYPDQEEIKINFNTKEYFPELEPLLAKYESRTRILWKDLPKADVEDIVSQKMTSMKDKLKEFDNQTDAEAFLNAVINQVNSYIGSPIEVKSVGSRN
jgi:hypothetical protein